MNPDPAAVETPIVQRLARIHPLNLSGLLAQSVVVLAQASGLNVDHPIFLQLRAVRAPDELARFDWEKLAYNLQFQPWLHECRGVVLSVRLMTDRAILHQQLYLSKSASTLELLGQCTLPRPVPQALLGTAEEFELVMCEADRSLHTGRALLDRFQDQALQGGAWELLCSLLDRAQVCYQGYLQALQHAGELRDDVQRYLATDVTSPYAA